MPKVTKIKSKSFELPFKLRSSFVTTNYLVLVSGAAETNKTYLAKTCIISKKLGGGSCEARGLVFTSSSSERAERLENADDDSVDELEKDDVRRQLHGGLQIEVVAGSSSQKGWIVAENKI